MSSDVTAAAISAVGLVVFGVVLVFGGRWVLWRYIREGEAAMRRLRQEESAEVDDGDEWKYT